MPRNGSFEKFYFERVALGESCGCAEQVIATRDLDETARPGESPEAPPLTLRDRLARFFARRPRP